MTVTYTHHVASSKGFGCFWKLLFRWRGSIYKLVWPDLMIYMILYATCSCVYRTALNEDQKRVFEKVSIHCQQFADLIPVAFVLGFYVSIVVQRWWEQYLSLPWPDALALFVSTCISGQDKRSRLMRRTIMRYVNLTFVITLSMISPRVKKRFPTLDHVLDAGFLTIGEKKIFDDLNLKTSHPKYWMPLVWAGAIVTRARKEGRIRDDFAVKTLVDEISKFRGLSGGLLSYDWISIPLVYTQVVTLAVYTFFLGTIMGRQFLEPRQGDTTSVDLYVPWFTFLQFFFYMGWLKVAESLVNPFGEDDDDFEVNWLIDRNLQVSYLIVDEMHEEHPELIQDRYWDEVFPQELPYTVAAEPYRRMAPQGSTFHLQVPEAEQEMYLMPLVEEDEMASDNSHHTKINMNNRPGSQESLQSSTSGIAMKPRRSSIGARKESVMSMFINRIMHSTHDNNSRRFSRLGSSASMRRVARTSHRLQRSDSHDSTALSHNSSRSRDGLAHNPSSLHRVGSATGRGAAAGRGRREEEQEGEHSPGPNSSRGTLMGSARQPDAATDWGTSAFPPGRRYERQVSMDEDGAILIRIKPDKRSDPKSSTSSTVRPSVAVTLASSTATTTTVTCSASSLHSFSAVAPSVPSTAGLRPLTSVMPGGAAAKNPRHTPPVSPQESMGRITSQELGSDEDTDSGDSPRQNDPLLPSAYHGGLPSSPDSDDQDTHTGTVRRNRKRPPPLCPLPEGTSYGGQPTHTNNSDEPDTKAHSSHDPHLRSDSLDKALQILNSGGDNSYCPDLAASGLFNKHGLESIEENPTQNVDVKTKPAQHLMTSPSLKRAQAVSPLLSYSDEGRLVDCGGPLSARGAPSSSLLSSSVIPSKYFSEHSTNMSLSSRFSDGKDGPKSPTDSSEASLMSSVFSRKSVSLEGLQEDKEGEANEEEAQVSPRPEAPSTVTERPVSAPVKQSPDDCLDAGPVTHFPSQQHIHSGRAKPPDDTNAAAGDRTLSKGVIVKSEKELEKQT